MLHDYLSFGFLISRFWAVNLHAGSFLGDPVEINHCGKMKTTAQGKV